MEGSAASAGTLLREAREAAGLHVATLAANLKVPVRKLEALEEDRYDQLGDAVFIRALASSVCRTLKIDPQPVLERLPQTARPRLIQDDDGINAPFRAPGDGPAPGLPQQVSRPVALIVVALLLAAVVLIFLPKRDDEAASAGPAKTGEPAFPPGAPVEIHPPAETAPAAAAPASAPAAVASAPAAVAAAPAAPASLALRPASAVPSLAAPAAPAVPAPAAAASAIAAAATPAASAASAAASAAAIAAKGVVTFRTRGNSWIQVTDAAGTTVFRKLMGPGDVAGASGTLPLAVTIGSVEQTEVQVRGKPFNLGPVSRDNVARFEVK
ncbi:helix-turn-helix domain-containing protein [Ramlibacter sp. XY19]|uniref:helix-turn-helix domain-containing protein n=1 Tax=Ramlibacter paludis TaxID=2908000 RepID=UPI0023DC7C08|nr:helix-turn-helix domain-containing protein [Ramlibacter paludis]